MSFLKKERERLGILQKEIIDTCGVSKGTVIRWESGDAIPSDKLGKLMPLGFDIQYICTGVRSGAEGSNNETSRTLLIESYDWAVKLLDALDLLQFDQGRGGDLALLHKVAEQVHVLLKSDQLQAQQVMELQNWVKQMVA